jgi:uncharacterized GH25 family protein
MKRNKLIVSIALCLTLCLAASAAWSHDLWITCPKAKAGEKLLLDITLGHGFPAGDKVKPEELVETYVLGKGVKFKTEAKADHSYQSLEPLAAGSYVAVSGNKAKFWTKAPSGYVHKTKDQVPEAIKCIRSVKYAKAIVNLGGKAADVSKPLGQDLEIVPMKNPADLKMGEELPIKVLLAGKPLPKAEVTATFAGFSQDRAMAFYNKTNKDGMVKVKLWHPGLWLVRVNQQTHYKDPAKCDVMSKTATLTFEIK